MQEQPPPPPAGPSIDIGGLVNGIVQGFQTVLTGWANQLPDQTATSGLDIVHRGYDWLSLQGINFILQTPIALVTAGEGVIGGSDVRRLLGDVATLTIVLAGLSYLGQYLFGWPGLSESVGRIVTTIILVSVTGQLLTLSLNVFNGMIGAIHVTLPSFPSIGDVPPLMLLGFAIVWGIMAFRLALQMGKRLIWLATLFPLGAVASIGFIHGKSAWVAGMYWRMWLGWLFGQFVAIVAIAVSLTMLARVGGPAGYILSVGALMVAHDAVQILAPKDGGVSVNVGVGPIRLPL